MFPVPQKGMCLLPSRVDCCAQLGEIQSVGRSYTFSHIPQKDMTTSESPGTQNVPFLCSVA